MLILAAATLVIQSSMPVTIDVPQEIDRPRLGAGWYVAPVLANAADLGTTLVGFDKGLHEANPLLGKHPSVGKVVAVKLVTTAVSVGGTYFFDRICHKPGLAKWWSGATSGVNLATAASNARLISRQR